MGASVQMLIAGIFLSVIGISIGELPRLSFEINGLLSLAYLIIFGSFVGYASYIYALAKLPLSLVSTFAYINPVIALFLGMDHLGRKAQFSDRHRCGGDYCRRFYCEARRGPAEKFLIKT